MYAEHETPVRSTKDLFGNFVVLQNAPKKRNTGEYNELVSYFVLKSGFSRARVGFLLKGQSDLKTLYYYKSVCDKYELEGGVWIKCFRGMLKKSLAPT